MCQRQKSLGSSCNSTNECRTDLNYTCLQFYQCGPLSVLQGESVAGYGNATAGNDNIALNNPVGIYVLPNNDFFVTDSNNARVQRYSLGSKIGQTVAGNDGQGNIYVAEYLASRIVRWSPNATNLTVVAGNGTSGSSAGLLSTPRHIYLDTTGTYLYIADYGNNRVQLWNMSSIGNIANASGITVAGGNGAGIASNQLNGPRAVVVSSKNGAVYVSDTSNNRIQRWAVGASTGSTIAGDPNGLSGSSPSLLNSPIGLAIDADETHLFLSDTTNNRVQRFRLI
ncbi:unnamed protein product [Rotaria socialis]|uniref:NHL repeat containing protein n=1 Tax=Rotaria socialis TaxID=392032 RepID=A0A818RNH5_9BILA|nr:unnamed protein product [Rotaria socialis]CAF4250003.1 unnamed protein product [Rotaria socialis]